MVVRSSRRSILLLMRFIGSIKGTMQRSIWRFKEQHVLQFSFLAYFRKAEINSLVHRGKNLTKTKSNSKLLESYRMGWHSLVLSVRHLQKAGFSFYLHFAWPEISLNRCCTNFTRGTLPLIFAPFEFQSTGIQHHAAIRVWWVS